MLPIFVGNIERKNVGDISRKEGQYIWLTVDQSQ